MTDLASHQAAESGPHGHTAATGVSGPAAGPGAQASGVQSSTGEGLAADAAQADVRPGPVEAMSCAAPPEGAEQIASASTADAGQQKQAAAGGETQADSSETEAEVAARLAQAEEFKREGNELFGSGQWEAASVKYNQALDEGGGPSL